MKNELTYLSDRRKYQSDIMTNEEKQVLVRLPEDVHKALSDDADRCRRSIKGQVEAILVAYYELGDVELRDVEPVRKIASSQSRNSKTQKSSNVTDPQSPSLFVHSAGSEKPANTRSRAIQKDIQSVKDESERRIRQMKEKGTEK
jgi:hypothetical protein